MALDTIKTTKNHKTFPFTSPTITPNNPPTGALILEIIFSADDVSPPSTNQNHNEEEGDEEGDNEGDSDDEDDIDNGTNSDSHSHQSDSDEDDEEEDEEEGDSEDTKEESDEEEEEDDGEQQFDDEDFGNDFDKDLIIDFGTADNEDQLVVEFEDTSSNSPPPSPRKPSPTPPATAVPFWYTHEEPDQIRMIFESYTLTLDLEKQRKACVRAPAPFIGRIKRTPIKPAESDTDRTFQTLDKVEIYLRELYPLGTILPLSRVAWVLTTWDEDGVPVTSEELNKSTKTVHPQQLTSHLETMQKRAQANQSSTLYCAPVFRTKEEYQYTVSSQDHSLMYASNSATNLSISRISPFLPEHCRNISFSLD